MEIFNISHAKTHLSALIARVEAGEEIVIGRADKPLAKLVPFRDEGKASFVGVARGRIAVPAAQIPAQWLEAAVEDGEKTPDLFSVAA